MFKCSNVHRDTFSQVGARVHYIYGMNFANHFFVHSHVTNIITEDNVACFEYNMCGIEFAVFHNFDKNFAYDVTIYHKEKKYNKRPRSIIIILTKEILK